MHKKGRYCKTRFAHAQLYKVSFPHSVQFVCSPSEKKGGLLDGDPTSPTSLYSAGLREERAHC